MLKTLFAEFMIAALLMAALFSPAAAQTKPTSLNADTNSRPSQDQPNETLKETLNKQSKNAADETASFDPAKADALYQKQNEQPKKWSTTKKVLVITAISVGVAALLFVLIKYSKDCARTEPPNCDWINDEFCRCVEYVPRNP